MSYQMRKSSTRRRIHLEILESRELLSAVGIPAHPAMEVSPLARKKPRGETITGSLTGQGVSSTNGGPQGTETLTATGTATILGPVTFSGSVNYKAMLKKTTVTGFKFSNGAGVLSDSTGDQIAVSFSGSAFNAGLTYDFSLKGPVKGGAGRFSKPAGKFAAHGSLSLLTNAFSISSLTIKLKRI